LSTCGTHRTIAERKVRFRGFQAQLVGAGLIVAAMLTSPGCIAAEAATLQPDNLWTPERVARLKSVAAVRMSPDGTQIAYLLRVPRKPFQDDDGPAWSELHVVNQAGRSRPFITGPVDVSAVQWTPDGRGVSFLSKRGKDEHKSLYVIPIDGGEARKVLAAETDVAAYSWSPDGSEIAYLATEKLPADHKKRQDKGFGQEIFEEDWRPVRVWISKPSWDADSDPAKPRMLELPGSASELHWAPVGRRLALALAPTPSIDDEYMRRKVRVVDVDTGTVLARLENPGKLGQIAWSPDATHLAMISAEDLHDPSAGRLMAASAQGGPLVDLLPAYDGEVTAIAWQDAKTVMFLGDEGVWTTFGEIGHDGKNRKSHVPAEKAVMSGLSLSRDGQSAAVVGESPQHPGEVFAMSHGQPGMRRLTDANPWLKDIRFAKQEVFTWKARDGMTLQGLLISPLEGTEKPRSPLIVTVHGGPEAHDRNGWLTSPSNPGQVAAAKGFFVLYPNYRGSTGRGVAFSKLGQADYAGKEFDDLLDAVDSLIATRPVDGSRVGVTGGSYGGFASAWCATYYSNRFAAAVMNVGVSDHYSMAGTTDIPDEWFLVHARKRLWDDWKFFLERSPIYHVQKCKTPILILHGKDDPRVPRTQSLELYRHLKTLNQVPVRLVYYPGEGHGNRKAAARYDYNLRMMQWFEHYLQGPGGPAPAYDLAYPLENSAPDGKPELQND
jgi:dipeptidyl aminopeptidase/acylaminoacyl peptidase